MTGVQTCALPIYAVQYLWLRLLAQTRKNLCVVGDDDQCLVAGTRVTMADRTSRRIEQIKVGDMVLSCYGSSDFRPACVSKTHKQNSENGLIKITTASGRVVTSTTNHIHFADFVPGESPQQYFTYLMHKRGTGYRLGTSQIYTKGQKRAVIGFKQRCLQEHADAVWLIAAFDTEIDAREHEHRLSLRHGITTMPFVARKGGSINGLVHDQERLNRLHTELDSAPKALQLMAETGLSADYPHHVPQTSASKRKTLQLTLYAEIGRAHV